MISPRLAEIARLFAEAELALKKYERIGLTSLSAALNELRYAGQHILAAEQSDAVDVSSEHLDKAERHCIRARYDAKEATIVAVLRWLATYRNYGMSSTELGAVYPDWAKTLGAAEHARKVLERSGHARDAEGAELDEALETILTAREKLLEVTPMILAKRQAKLAAKEAEVQAAEDENRQAQLDSEKLREIREDRRYVISTILAVLGTVLSALGLVLAFL